MTTGSRGICPAQMNGVNEELLAFITTQTSKY
jgi:hypothetical protein